MSKVHLQDVPLEPITVKPSGGTVEQVPYDAGASGGVEQVPYGTSSKKKKKGNHSHGVVPDLFGDSIAGTVADFLAAPATVPIKWGGLGASHLAGDIAALRHVPSAVVHQGGAVLSDIESLINLGRVGTGGSGLRVHERPKSETWKVAKELGTQYKDYYYSREVLRHLWEHPLQPILDGLTIATLGGAGIARLGALGALGERGAELGKVGTRTFRTDAGLVTKETSHNPTTRALQNLRHTIILKSTGYIERKLGEQSFGENIRGMKVLQRKQDRILKTMMNRDLSPFDKAFRGLTGPEEVAISLRAQGLDPATYVPMLKKAAQESFDAITNAKSQKEAIYHEGILKAHERMLKMVSRVTPELYAAITETPKYATAYQAAKTLMDKAAETGINLNILRVEDVEARPWLAVRVMGGARYTPYEQIARDALEANPSRALIREAIDQMPGVTPEEAADFLQHMDDSLSFEAARGATTADEVIANLDRLYSEVGLDALSSRHVPETQAGKPGVLSQEEMDMGAAGKPVEKAKVEPQVKEEHLIEKHQGDLPDSIDHEAIANRILASGLKLPEELMAPGALAGRIQHVYQMVKAGANGRFWYDTAEGVARHIAENDPAAKRIGLTPKQVAQMIAVFSQSADTVANMAFLRKAIDQYDQHRTVYAGIFPERQHVEILNILEGKPWAGRKRSSFYMNMIEKLDPAEHAALMKERAAEGITTSDAANPVTVDRWVTRWFIPDKDVPGAYYDAFERVLQEMGAELGWEPKEVQAAAWVASKQLALAKRHPKWTLSQVEKAGEDAYNVGFDRYFGETQGRLATGAKLVHPAAERAANLANRPDGGGTLRRNLSPDNSKRGYVTSHGAFEQIASAPIKGAVIQAYRDMHNALLKKDRSARVGIWHNPENGMIYLDVSRRFSSKSQALAWGREQGQLAIWDAAKGESIKTGLTEAEANVIKTRLRDEHFGPDKPSTASSGLRATPNPNSAIEQWDALVDHTAREHYTEPGRKPTKPQLDAAEKRLYEEGHPDAMDLHRRAIEEGNSGPIEMYFQREKALEGLPEKGSPSLEATNAARAYTEKAGIDYNPPTTYVKADPERGARIAKEYDDMVDMHDPAATPEYAAEVQAAYDAMIQETLAQYEEIVASGYTFEFYPEGEFPYNSPWDAMKDLKENQHLSIFPTSEGYGTLTEAQRSHPLLGDSGLKWNGKAVTHNDVFRAVHDFFGHFKEGVGFRADGEENAWRSHSAMYTDIARKAMTSETRGQNSWVNFGPHAEKNLTAGEAETIYADQKAGVMPDWVVNEGREDAAQAQRVGLSGGKARGIYRPGTANRPARLTVGTSAEVDTLIHEWAHHVETFLHGAPEERYFATKMGATLDKSALPGMRQYVWSVQAKENFANLMMQWARRQKGPMGDALRKQYYERDLPELDPTTAATFDRMMKRKPLSDGKFVGGPALEEVQAALKDLIAFPHIGEALKPGSFPGKASGVNVPIAPALTKMNKAYRLLTSQWLPHPSAWRTSYVRIMGYAAAVQRHQFAWDIGKELGPGLERHPGYYYVREGHAAPSSLQKEQSALDEAYHQFEQKDGGDVQKYVEHNASTQEESVAKQWQDEGYSIRQISPKEHRLIFGEFKQASAFVAKWIDRPTNAWRTLTLTYRPAWMVNNLVGQTLLFALNHGSPGGMAAYVEAMIEEIRRDNSLPDELRMDGLWANEAPAMKSAFNKFVRGEHRVRDGIQRLNTAVSDSIPRNATYKTIIHKMEKTDETARELGQYIRGNKGNTEHLPAHLRELHDKLVQQVLDELIDFGNLSDFERRYIRRFVPFYSWIKGIMKATGHLAMEHPARALILYNLGVQGEKVDVANFGAGAKILSGFTQLGKASHGVVPGISTTGLNPWATPAQIMDISHGSIFGGGNPGDNLIFQMNPAVQAVVAGLAGVDPFSKHPNKRGFIPSFLESLAGAPPQYDLIKGLISPQAGARKLTPQTRLDLLARYFGIPITHKRVSTAKSLANLNK